MRAGEKVGRLEILNCVRSRTGYRVSARCECGQVVSDTLSQFARGKRKTCGSESCRQLNSRNGARRRVNHRGYVMIRVGYGSQRKEVQEHRIAAERMLGRKLRRDEHVHHLNGITTDNRPENLEVIDSREHSRKHADLLAEVFRLRKENRELRKQIQNGGRD